MAKDDDFFKDFGQVGRTAARKMLDRTEGSSGYKTTYTWTPDGFVRMQTHGGFPRTYPVRRKPDAPPPVPPLTKWMLQAFMAPTAINGTTEYAGIYGYTVVGVDYQFVLEESVSGEYRFTDFRPKTLGQRNELVVHNKGVRDWIHWPSRNNPAVPIVTFIPDAEEQSEHWQGFSYYSGPGGQTSDMPYPVIRYDGDWSGDSVFVDGEHTSHPIGKVASAYIVDNVVYALQVSGANLRLNRLDSGGWSDLTGWVSIPGGVVGPVVVNSSGTECAYKYSTNVGGRVVQRLAKTALPGLVSTTEECDFWTKQYPANTTDDGLSFSDVYEETTGSGFGDNHDYSLGETYRSSLSTKTKVRNKKILQKKSLVCYGYSGDTLKKLYVIRRYEFGDYYDASFSGVSMVGESVSGLIDDNKSLIQAAAIAQGKNVLSHVIDGYAAVLAPNGASGGPYIIGAPMPRGGDPVFYPRYTPWQRLATARVLNDSTNTAYSLTLATVTETYGTHKQASLHYQIDDGPVKTLHSWRSLTGAYTRVTEPTQSAFPLVKELKTVAVPDDSLSAVIVDLWRVSWGASTGGTYYLSTNTAQPDTVGNVAHGKAIVGADVRHGVYVTRDFSDMAMQVHFSPPDFPQAFEVAAPVGTEIGVTTEAAPVLPFTTPALTFMGFPFSSINSLTVHPSGNDCAWADSAQVLNGGMWYGNNSSTTPTKINPSGVEGARFYNPIYYRKSAE